MRTRLVSVGVALAVLTGCGAGRSSAERVAAGAAGTASTAGGGGVATTTVRPRDSTVVGRPTSTISTPSTASTRPVAASVSSSTVPVTDRRVVPRGPYTDWNWAPPAGGGSYARQDLNVTVASDPGTAAPYFFAHQFGFEKGLGGYIGLQTRGGLGPEPGGPVGKIAIFSVFAGCDDRAATSGCPRPLPLIGASAQPGLLNGSWCSPLTSPTGTAPEGPGATCRVPFEWREGVTYGLQVLQAAPHVWEARIVDGGTGAVSVVGRIRVPDAWGGLSTFSVSWIEFYGDTRSMETCADLPATRSRWDGATAFETIPGGLLGLDPTTLVSHPRSIHNHLAVGQGLCANSSITDVPPIGSAVVHAIGGP